MVQQARTAKQKKRKREIILKAAREIFFEKGYLGTRVESIARRSGISTGTFYLYFQNKIEIYKTLQNEGIDILIQMFQRAAEKSQGNVFQKLTEIANAYLRFYREYGEYFDLIAILGATSRDLKETESVLSREIFEKTQILLQFVRDILAEGIEDGEISDMNPWSAAVVLWGLMDGLILLEERRNIHNIFGLPLEEMLRQALDISFYGLSRDDRLSQHQLLMHPPEAI